MANIIYTGKTYSSFSGFSDNAIFKMSNGSYWVQTKYKYWYHYAYRPDVVISEENGQTILTVAGHSIPVKRVYDVIESQIDGEFNGWDGNTRYKLTNGQEWQQTEYHYCYKYAYRPDVMIYQIGGKSMMYVDGTQATVKRLY